MKLYKKILIGFISLLIPTIVWAANAPSQVNRFTAGYIAPLIGTDWVQAPYFTATSTTATSTFANGLNLTGGCFEINGACFTGGTGSQTPWTQNINGGGYSLSNTNDIGVNAGGIYQYNGKNVISASTTLTNYFFANAGNTTATGTNNIAVGYNSLSTDGSGSYNTSVGLDSLQFNTTGSSNTAVGSSVLLYNTTGAANSAYGRSSLVNNINGSLNSAFGNSTLGSNTTGNYNNAFGYSALNANVSGGHNTAMGTQALSANTTGSYNVAIGEGSAEFTNSSFNVAIGQDTLYSNGEGGANNVALGAYSLNGNNGANITPTNYNSDTGLGASSFYNLVTGNNSTAIGVSAGYSQASSSNTTIIGANADFPTASTSNSLDITNIIYATGLSNPGTPTGVVSTGNVGIGTTSPFKTLSVQGDSFIAGNETASSFTATSTTANNVFMGNVGIGITAPSYPLQVLGNIWGIEYLIPDTSGNSQNTTLSRNSNKTSFISSNGGTNSYSFDGNVGIGTVNPNYLLEVNGAASTSQLYGSNLSTCNSASNALTWNAGLFGCNTITGGSGTYPFTPSSDNGINTSATSTPLEDTASGLAMDVSQYGWYGQGGQLLAYASSTNQDTIFGLGAGGQNATTSASLSSNSFFGQLAGAGTNGDINDTGIGYKALEYGTNGLNVAIGYTTLSKSTFIGLGDTVVGTQGGLSMTSGDFNTGVGYSSLLKLSTGLNNTAVGAYTQGVTTGSNNTFLGSYTASTTTSGSNNIAIGYDIATPSITSSNTLNIGNLIFGTGINGEGTTLSTGNIGIATTTPTTTLDVNGSVNLEEKALATTTSMSLNFCTTNYNISMGVGSSNIALSWYGAAACPGVSHVLSINNPASGLIGSTTISTSDTGVNFIWDRGYNPGNSVLFNDTDVFCLTSKMATTSTGLPYILSSLCE